MTPKIKSKGSAEETLTHSEPKFAKIRPMRVKMFFREDKDLQYFKISPHVKTLQRTGTVLKNKFFKKINCYFILSMLHKYPVKLQNFKKKFIIL